MGLPRELGLSGLEKEQELCMHLLAGARAWAKVPEARDTRKSDQAGAGCHHHLPIGAPG